VQNPAKERKAVSVAKQKQSAPAPVYQMKVTLLGVRPLVWRRFQVTSDQTLYQLHLVLQTVMGWENYHLYEFSLANAFLYGENDHDLENTSGVRLDQLVHAEKQIFYYTYDMGDYWEHEILVERILKPKKGVKHPVCLKGNRACPPEDSGGPIGYTHMLRVIRNKRHPEYREMMDWLGERFDPTAFDLKDINRELRRLGK
jgi:integrase/recombinase XerD